MRYFTSIRLALAPVNEKNLFKAIPNQLVITVRRLCFLLLSPSLPVRCELLSNRDVSCSS